MARSKGVEVNEATATSTQTREGLRTGDEPTWNAFVARYRPRIILYARRLSLTPDEAEDGAQLTLEAFTNAYRAGKYDRELGRLRDWLFGIATNQIRKVFHQRPKELQGSTTVLDGKETDRDLQAVWDAEWQHAVIQQCLATVRTEFKQRTVRAFELYVLKEMAAKEAATVLGISTNAVFIAKFKILRRIREIAPQIEVEWS